MWEVSANSVGRSVNVMCVVLQPWNYRRKQDALELSFEQDTLYLLTC